MKILQSLLFYPLLWLRGLFIRVGRILAGLLLLGTVLSLFFGGVPVKATIAWAVMSFALFMLCHFYDVVLIKLNPTDNILLLD